MTKLQYEAKKAALIKEIERAFDGVEREDGVTFHEARVIDDYGSDAERAQARLEDTENRWQDVPDELLINGDQIISFLDVKGFRYYLPAYLVWYLRYMDNEDEEFSSDTFDSVDFYLMAWHEPGKEARNSFDALILICLEQFKSLNFEQSKAVAHFLEFRCERALFLNEQNQDDVLGWECKNYQRALDLYWGRFLVPESV